MAFEKGGQSAATNIPKILHQTAKDKTNLREEWVECRKTWLKQLTTDDWDIRLWDDDENDRFVSTYYPQYYQLYLDMPRPINRVDMVRMLYMHAYGGFYADCDTKCLKPIDPLCNINDCQVVLGYHDSMIGRFVECAFMGSVPGHPFWIDVVEAMKAARYHPTFSQKVSGMMPMIDVLTQTGPLLFTSVINKQPADRGIKLFPSAFFYPSPNKPFPTESYVVHMFTGSWVTDGREKALLWLEKTTTGRCVLTVLVAVIATLLFLFLLWMWRKASTTFTNLFSTNPTHTSIQSIQSIPAAAVAIPTVATMPLATMPVVSVPAVASFAPHYAHYSFANG
jgi:mannosyltransferase OCH1-like enzyme